MFVHIDFNDILFYIICGVALLAWIVYHIYVKIKSKFNNKKWGIKDVQ